MLKLLKLLSVFKTNYNTAEHVESEHKLKKGYSLIELMVVIIIIGILAALAIPKFMGATDKAKLSEAKINCKAISTQCLLERVENGSFPTDLTNIDWYKENGNSLNSKYFTFSLNATGDSVQATPIENFGEYVAGTDFITYSLMGLGDINGVK